ncbi:MAG: hypothetical protein BGO78_05850 [Chloroflexi bacterium 44-23]|nr:MAG: hypothetical protein BGO78_05850 [Chloroflexi bacterium 44-23]
MENNSHQLVRSLRWAALLAVGEAVIVLVVLLTIEADPKNAAFLGLSWKRWLLILFAFSIMVAEINLFRHPQRLQVLADAFLPGSPLVRRTELWGAVAAVLLWLVIWFPPERLKTLQDNYVRLLPVLILVLVISLQYFLVLESTLHRPIKLTIKQLYSANRKTAIGLALIMLAIIIVFMVLRLTSFQVGTESTLSFPPNSILTSLQIFSGWVLWRLLLFYFPGLTGKNLNKPRRFAAIFLVIWLAAFVTWMQTPLACVEDRPGPYPPNNACYPPIDDAVYSIGSFYVGLGEGVYNQWLTDKPLYQVFMATGQAIFGEEIDRYIIFQIAVLALIPAVIFYLGALILKFSGSGLLAVYMILKGFNEIRLYPKVAGMNVKIENSEGLLTLLIICVAIFLFRWLQNPDKKKWAVLTGGMLGLSILVRFNSLALVPLILVLFIWISRKARQPLFKGVVFFLVTLSLTILPWFVTARNASGSSYYWIKIRDVIELRFDKKSSQQQSTQPYMASPVRSMALAAETTTAGQGFLFHFLNNSYNAIAEMPINLRFLSGNEITSQDLWKVDPRRPIWLVDLSPGNLISMSLSLMLILVGITLTWQKFGLAGISPLILQGSYFIGNAAAMTSGERYLLPVGWVTMLYYCIGLLAAINQIQKLFWTGEVQPLFAKNAALQNGKKASRFNERPLVIILWMAIFVLAGSSTYLVNFLPKQLAVETSDLLREETGRMLLKLNLLTNQEWNSFKSNPDALIVSVRAYHPRIYRNERFAPGMEFFELMGLGRDYVYVSRMIAFSKVGYFTAGSDVTLVGCKTGQESVWNSEHIFMKTNVVIQNNNEKQVIFSQLPDWSCARP